MALIGYARVSTAEQDTALQTDALRKVGCERVFEDVVSGAKADRPGLAAALAYLRDGDVLLRPLQLFGSDDRLASAFSPTRSGSGQSGLGAVTDQVTLKLSQRTEHMKDEPSA